MTTDCEKRRGGRCWIDPPCGSGTICEFGYKRALVPEHGGLKLDQRVRVVDHGGEGVSGQEAVIDVFILHHGDMPVFVTLADGRRTFGRVDQFEVLP